MAPDLRKVCIGSITHLTPSEAKVLKSIYRLFFSQTRRATAANVSLDVHVSISATFLALRYLMNRGLIRKVERGVYRLSRPVLKIVSEAIV